MSKSIGNYIGIDEPPNEIFGKVMSIPDELIYHYFELATDVTLEKLEQVKAILSDSSVNPMIIKKELAEILVDMYHPRGSGKKARAEFERVFSQKQIPDDIPQIHVDDLTRMGLNPAAVYLVHLMSQAKLCKSNSEARKLIQGGGVSLDGNRITDPDFEFSVTRDMILKVGKRRFLRIRA
jgi:tyrosyl-tRNA synthetase